MKIIKEDNIYMNIENYENLSNEVSANLNQDLTKGEIATLEYLLLSKYYNSIIDEMKLNHNMLKANLVNTISPSLHSCSKFSAKQLSEE